MERNRSYTPGQSAHQPTLADHIGSFSFHYRRVIKSFQPTSSNQGDVKIRSKEPNWRPGQCNWSATHFPFHTTEFFCFVLKSMDSFHPSYFYQPWMALTVRRERMRSGHFGFQELKKIFNPSSLLSRSIKMQGRYLQEQLSKTPPPTAEELQGQARIPTQAWWVLHVFQIFSLKSWLES